MTRERMPWHRSLVAAAPAVAIAIFGCAVLEPLVDSEILEPAIELVFERPSDLIPAERFRVTSTANRQISLAWDPVLVGDVAGYVITRSDTATGNYEAIGQTYSRFESVYTDTGSPPEGLGDGSTYHYRLHPYDSEGRVSRSHAYLVTTTDPPPEVPSNLRAYSNLPRRVVLEWEPSMDLSVASYAVYRSPTVAGPWERVANVRGRLQTVHEDPVPGDLRVMYYRIRALNAFGGSSDMTQPIRAMTKAEPLPPTDLALQGKSLGSIHLRWAPNVEKDIRTYQIWRAGRDGQDWGKERLIAQITPPATELVDGAVDCGEDLRYRLRAIDADDLVSGFSKPLEAIGEDIRLEATPKDNETLELRWDAERVRDWPTIEIFERRWILPDRSLSDLVSAHDATIPDIGPGPHRLAVILSRANTDQLPTVPTTDETLDTVVCEIFLRVPRAGPTTTETDLNP